MTKKRAKKAAAAAPPPSRRSNLRHLWLAGAVAAFSLAWLLRRLAE